MISGKTTLIAHIGYPTESFKAPLIYNPWFEHRGIDAVVVPMGVQGRRLSRRSSSRCSSCTNIRGALITMPHKVTTVALLDEATHDGEDRRLAQRHPEARRTARCSATCSTAPDSRAACAQGLRVRRRECLVVGAGGVGSAIAASLAAEGVARDRAVRRHAASATASPDGLREHYPQIEVDETGNDPAGYDLVVNATPLGMKAGDPLPFDVDAARAVRRSSARS